jgi:hypothetical protein
MTSPKPFIKCTYKELKDIIITADRQIAEWKKVRGRVDGEIIRRHTQLKENAKLGGL